MQNSGYQTNPFVSIIIPVFNGAKTLVACLESIMKGTYENYEIIVVDNNSNDSTRKIIEEFSKKNKNIRYTFEPKKGRGPARNTGEKMASGEIVLMTDCDATVPNEWIEKMIQPIVTEEVDAVQGFEETIGKDFWSRGLQSIKQRQWQHINDGGIVGNIDTKNFAVSMKTLKEIGYSSAEYVSGNDTDLSFKLMINNKKIAWLKGVKVKHLNPSTFLSVGRKQLYRGYWSAKIDHDYGKKIAYQHQKEKMALTLSSFFNLKALYKNATTHGLSSMLYDLTAGGFWRIGIVSFKIKKTIFC